MKYSTFDTINHRFIVFIVCFLTLSSSPTIAQQNDWVVFNTKNSPLPTNNVRDVKFDETNVAWIATWGGGLASYNSGSWTIFDQTNSGLPSSHLNQLAIDAEGKIWVATEGGGVATFDGSLWSTIDLPNNNSAQCIAIHENGDVFIGTFSDGLYRYSNDELNKLWGETGRLLDGVYDISFSVNKELLVSTSQGLLQFSEDLASHTVLSEEHFSKARMNKEEEIWAIGFHSNKVHHFNGRAWVDFQNTNSRINVSLNNEKPTYYARTMTLAKNGMPIVGTTYYGAITRYTAKGWRAINTPYSSKKMDGGIQAITTDKWDNPWIGTWNKGLMVPGGNRNPLTKNAPKKVAIARSVNFSDTIKFQQKYVELQVWDSQKVDGDTISLIYNGEYLLQNYALKKEAKSIRIKLDPDGENDLVLYAHNLGSVPPNTALVSIVENDKIDPTLITLKSDMENSQGLLFKVIQNE